MHWFEEMDYAIKWPWWIVSAAILRLSCWIGAWKFTDRFWRSTEIPQGQGGDQMFHRLRWKAENATRWYRWRSFDGNSPGLSIRPTPERGASGTRRRVCTITSFSILMSRKDFARILKRPTRWRSIRNCRVAFISTRRSASTIRTGRPIAHLPPCRILV